ncbi:hypothetical protein FLAT13_03638 [Flavobacterium salmonis]|uniref:Uncharacterized protein n=1 Tax=Flavobacterium salmonis TaxID=2654844 RepID=A0A6V6Z6F5_9FLAO|nr:hypothetical protein FLAT13_03638 [Flavobacterium salmonis]
MKNVIDNTMNLDYFSYILQIKTKKTASKRGGLLQNKLKNWGKFIFINRSQGFDHTILEPLTFQIMVLDITIHSYQLF